MSSVSSARKQPKTATGDTPPRVASDIGCVAGMLNRFLRGNRVIFVLALALLVAEAATEIASKYPLAYLIDYLGGKKSDLLAGQAPFISPQALTLTILSVAIIGIAMINSLTDSLAEMHLARGGRRLGFNLRTALYAHLQKLSLAFYSNQRTGDLLTRVTGDVSAIEDFAIDSFKDLASSVFILAIALVALFSSAWQIALMALVMVPVLSVVSNSFADRIKSAAKQLRAREAALPQPAPSKRFETLVLEARSSHEGEQGAIPASTPATTAATSSSEPGTPDRQSLADSANR